MKNSFAFSLLVYLSDKSNFPILQPQQSEHILPKPSSRKSCPWRILQILVRFQFSRLTRSLGHLANSKSISKNPTTTYHPNQIEIIWLMYLLSFDVQLLQFRLSLIDEEWVFDDSMIILHNAFQILIDCTYEYLLASATATETFVNCSTSFVNFSFDTDSNARREPVPKQRIRDFSRDSHPS